MPRVLITGLNGFVAVHVAKVFLDEGWSVRGTVRSQSKVHRVRSLPVFEDKEIEVVILDDLINGDFTEALDGVDAVSMEG
jgi:nucleoside-diphosphate-sugar epimerase